jgi:hypothetical protein
VANLRVLCGHRYGQSISASQGDWLDHRRATWTTCPTPTGRPTGHPTGPGRNARGIGLGGQRSGRRPHPTPHGPRPCALGVHRGAKQPPDAGTGNTHGHGGVPGRARGLAWPPGSRGHSVARVSVSCDHRYGQSISASQRGRLGLRRATWTTCSTPTGHPTGRFIILTVSR